MQILSKILTKVALKKFILVHLVLGLVVLDFLSSNVRDVVKELRQFHYKKTESKESRHERRLAKVKNILPEHGTVGYITNREYNNVDDIKFFYLTQYSLSPLIVVRSTKPQTIVADVNRSFNIIKFSKKYNCNLVKDLGNGILVFQKRTK